MPAKIFDLTKYEVLVMLFLVPYLSAQKSAKGKPIGFIGQSKALLEIKAVIFSSFFFISVFNL